jgi:thiamine-monophosphate kinase
MDHEHYLIDRLRSPYIGDDAAVVGKQLFSVDAFCEGTHFRREWMRPEQIGRKAMLVNLSDAVAMNADPEYALLSLGLPADMEREAIAAMLDAIETTAREWGCELIGGDTVRSDKLHLSITLIARSNDPLLRTGLREGDLLAYTGVLGKSLRDLKRLERGETIAPDSRFFEPVLRREFVRRARPFLRAGMDISDGLYCDTNTLLDRNGLGMDILKNITPEIGESGEEYEMLIACDPERRNALESVADSLGVGLTFFARVVEGSERFPCRSHHFG